MILIDLDILSFLSQDTWHCKFHEDTMEEDKPNKCRQFINHEQTVSSHTWLCAKKGSDVGSSVSPGFRISSSFK